MDLDVVVPAVNNDEDDIIRLVERNLVLVHEQQKGGTWPAGEQPMWVIRNFLGIPGSCRGGAGDYSNNPNYYYRPEHRVWAKRPGYAARIIEQNTQWKLLRKNFIDVLEYFTPADHYSKVTNLKDNDLDDFFRIVRQGPNGGVDDRLWMWIQRRLNNKFHKAHGEMISMFYSILKDILRSLKRIENLGVNNSGLAQKRKVACYVLDVDKQGIDPELAMGLGNGAPYDPVIHWDWPINKVAAPAELWEFEISGRVSLRSFMTAFAAHQLRVLGRGKYDLLLPHRVYLYTTDHPTTQEQMQNFAVELRNDYDFFQALNKSAHWPDHTRLLFKVVTHPLLGQAVYTQFREQFSRTAALEGEEAAMRLLLPENNMFINENVSIFHPFERYRSFIEFYRCTKPIHSQDMGTHIPADVWIDKLGMQAKVMQTPQGSEFGIATKDSGEYEMQHPDGDSEGEAEECARRDAVWVAQKARWRIEHVHSRHFMATINFSKKLFCKPLTITTSNGTTYRSAQTLDRDELFHRFQYECLVQGVKIYNDNKLRYPGTFDRVTEVFDTPGSERLLEWQQDVAQDYHRVIDQNGNTVAPWDTFPYLCRFSPPALMPTREHVLHPMDRPYPVQNGEQPIHHPGAPAPFVEDNGNGPRQMHYKWRFGMPEMEALLENYSPVPRLCTGPGNTLRWNPEQIGCMQSSLITNSARRFDPPNYADTLPHYGKAFSMIMVRGLAAARSRVEIKARVRRRQIAEELAAVDPLDLNAVNRITQPGPYSYSILRPEYQRADGTMVFDRRNPQELAPGGPADMIYRQYRIMKQQFVAIQTAQGETGPFSLPMPLNMRNAITLALAPMQPRAAEFVRIREAIAGQADRAREHFAQWQRWNPGRPVNEYLTPQYLTNPIPPPQVFATLNDYIYQGGVYTAFVPDISTYGSELLTAFQSYGSQPLSRPKRKADMLSPTVPEAPAKIFRKAIGLSGNSIELAPNGIGPATQQTGMVLGNTGNNALISVPTPQTALAAYNPSSTASNPVPFNYQDLFARDEPQTPPTFVPERASLVPEDNFTPLPPFNFDPNDHLYNSQVSTPVTVNRALPPTDIMDLRPEVQGLLGGEVGAMQVWIPTTVNGVLPVAGGNAHLGGEEGTMEGETFDFPELPAIVPGGFDYSQFLHEDLLDDSFVFSQSSFD